MAGFIHFLALGPCVHAVNVMHQEPDLARLSCTLTLYDQALTGGQPGCFTSDIIHNVPAMPWCKHGCLASQCE